MAEVVFDHVSKHYDRAPSPVVRDLSLTVRGGELLVLVGPSGCGKSTALRLIAGLESVSSGSLFMDGRRVNDLSPRDRDVAMVFQAGELDAQMTCFDNMAFALDVRGVRPFEVRRRVLEAACALEIDDILGLRPAELSGGQRQRVALGRAIVRRPRVFLMDEPLSNLDARLRASLRSEVERVHRETAATMVYVTHDQTDAMALGDRIAVIRGGDLVQVDRPERVYARPANAFVAAFIGAPEMNLLRGELVVHGDVAMAAGPGLRVTMPAALPRRGGAVLIGVRPEHVRPVGSSAALGAEAAHVSGVVERVEAAGASTFAHLRTEAGRLVCKVDGPERPVPGALLRVGFEVEHVHVFDFASGDRIG